MIINCLWLDFNVKITIKNYLLIRKTIRIFTSLFNNQNKKNDY